MKKKIYICECVMRKSQNVMKENLKNYQKPSVEIVDVQWNQCVAAGSREQRGFRVKLDPMVKKETDIWMGNSISGWNTSEGF